MKKTSVLFVCMGNICRSPTAEAVFRRQIIEAGMGDLLHIDSAGTHAYHIGNPPDARSMKTAAARGYAMDALRARQVTPQDIAAFDFVLAMDEDNLAILQRMAPVGQKDKPMLLMRFAPDYGRSDVPDPYYGGAQGFEQVLDMIEAASAGLLAAISQR